jgi:Ni,Fe-hydrogenase III large subunit
MSVFLRVCEPVSLDKIPVLDEQAFGAFIKAAIRDGQSVAAHFGQLVNRESVRVFSVLADKTTGLLQVVSCISDGSLSSLTPECPELHLFEREIAEQCALKVIGHPWLKPVRFSGGAGRRGGPEIGDADFFQVKGTAIHEVAVGPVHAGVIEPGHFRFQCDGEQVLHLEISLGYQHRGIEAALSGGPNLNTLPMMEAVAGDTTIGHALAYCQLIESLGNYKTPMRAQALRGIALELERCANHTGDLGALAGDVGYLPTMSYCGRIRGDFLNMTALLCGSRFGRGFLSVGGTGFDVDDDRLNKLSAMILSAERDLSSALDLMFSQSSVTSRFQTTGTVSAADCRSLGIVGPAARASGLQRDVRCDFPTGIYTTAQIPVVNFSEGDVFSRAIVRWRELQCSITFIKDLIASMPQGKTCADAGGPMKPDSLCISLIEGWRGEICHVGITNGNGAFSSYKIVDPSFHNWMALAMALRNQQISDFPLCNKSFNLSYCGFDL